MNRHLKVAFFAAPVLALLAYFLTDRFVAVTEVADADDVAMKLIGECRPVAGDCVFKRGDLELKLFSSVKQQQLQLAILSNRPLQAVAMALATDEAGFKQFPMMKADDANYWQIKLAAADHLPDFHRLRMVVKLGDKVFFAESEVIFDGN